MEHEVDEVVGPRGRHDAGRQAKRHGHTPGEVTLGGRRVPVSRPRVRTADDRAEVELESYAEFGSRDLLERVALERMLAGASTRRSRRVAEPVGAEVEREARSTSKSAVSRAFVGRTRRALDELLSRGLSELELAVVMIDGIELAGLTHVVTLGITQDGTKVPLSLREGSTENATVATALLSDLVERGLRLHEGQLTLTVTRLGVAGALKRTLCSTNPIESNLTLNQSVRFGPAIVPRGPRQARPTHARVDARPFRRLIARLVDHPIASEANRAQGGPSFNQFLSALRSP